LAATDLLEPGDVVDDYRIERVIGIGGMGTVYAAVHTVIDKRVALKLLRKDLCANPEAVRRFVQEARAVNRIGHRNIVDVFGFGVADDGRSYLAMELLSGENLTERIARGGLAIGEVCDVLGAISRALEAAHAGGVVHRDLKPDNVFLASDGEGVTVKLLDFGIAKLLVGAGPIRQTEPGTTVGTPAYIAPEQARGREVDGAADVYALGVIAFEMLTGRLPFEADNHFDVMVKHDTDQPPVPSELLPLPPVADVLVLAMLDKAAARRPSLARVRELLDELRGAAQPRAVAPTPVARARRARWPWALALLVAAAALVTVIDWATSGGSARGSSVRTAVEPASAPGRPPIAVPHRPPETTRPVAPAPTVTPLPVAPPPVPPTPIVADPGERRPPHRQPTTMVHHANSKPTAARAIDEPAPPPTGSAAPPHAPPAPPPPVEDDDALASPFHR
jgi:serine/threonine-protein kinase